MAPDASQISRWLKAARQRAGLTQFDAANQAGVSYGVVTNSEQTGAIMAVNLVALLVAYDAAQDFVNQLAIWESASGEAPAANRVGPQNSPHSELPSRRAAPHPPMKVASPPGHGGAKHKAPDKPKRRASGS